MVISIDGRSTENRMSVKVSLQEAQHDLSGLLNQLAATGEEFIVQHNGKDCAVIVSAKQWRRRKAAEKLDAADAAQRLSGDLQTRAQILLAAKKQRSLTAAERKELAKILKECDAIMTRRAKALDANP